MTTFSEIPYQRPDLDAYESGAAELLAEFAAAESFAAQWDALQRFLRLRTDVSGALEVASVRNTIDTRDEFYAAEKEFVDDAHPRLEKVNNDLYAAMIDSRFRPELERELGEHFFASIEVARKVFSPEIMEDLARENKLVTAYDKLTGAAQIEFRGETYNLAALGRFAEDPDRATRKEAQEATWGYFAEHADEFDRLYDELVQVRHGMAVKLGYENFVQMGYDRMGRTGYGPADVAKFRAGVLEHVVPQAAEVFARQQQRLGLGELTYYDLPFKFPSGNPRPQGAEAWMVERAQRMYDELSPETAEFFGILRRGELMDLSTKPGKQPGGYCTFLEGVELPFIFSNFNGTSHDVDVLTHEFGHSLQAYRSRTHLMSEQRFPSSEAAEVHSMSMEYLTYPWMESFFGADATKYHYDHQCSALTFLPYGSLVDAFQHWVYENPSASPAERKAQWRTLEQQFMPWVDYADNAFLAGGGRWQRQGHLYWMPFYYIDYCLAQLVAMQVFLRAQQDRAAMWRDYLTMCDIGGTRDFVDMISAGGLDSPFDPEVVRRTLAGIQADIDAIDVAALD